MDLFSKSSDIQNGVSGHVETVVLLSQLKQKPDDYINEIGRASCRERV